MKDLLCQRSIFIFIHHHSGRKVRLESDIVFPVYVRPSIRASWTLLSCYLEKVLDIFYQTFTIGAFWDKLE